MKKIILRNIAFFFAILLVLISFKNASAETRVFYITWKSTSYIPDSFEGISLPTTNSTINASFELIDGGKLADLSGVTTYWYLNNRLIQSGVGIQKASFKISTSPGGVARLKIQLPNYNGLIISKTIEIPVARPEIVIAPFSNSEIKERQFRPTALPYFFNVGSAFDLNYDWKINDQKVSISDYGDTPLISLDSQIKSGDPVKISLSAVNTYDQNESASRVLNLIFK